MSTRTYQLTHHLVRSLIGCYANHDSVVGALLRAMPLNATTRQLLQLNRTEQRQYFDDLWEFNRQAKPTNPAGHGALYPLRKALGFVRRFNQLPCTVDTRMRRADLLSGDDPSQCRILLLGDDDLLSVELAKRGYAHVTVADCDQALLERIGKETMDLETPPRIVQADFAAATPLADVAADVVFLDPPYNPEGVRAFIGLALRILKSQPNARLYLMINPDLLGASFNDLSRIAARDGLSLQVQRRGFNAYPISGLDSLLLRLAFRVALNRRSPGPMSAQLYFCSDCFEFRREA